MADVAQINTFPFQQELTNNPFPNEQVDPTVKNGKEFGLKMAAAIYWRGRYDEWLTQRRARIAINRAYASGRQDVNQYKPFLDARLDNAGDQSFMNIDWSIESPAPLVTKKLVGRLMNADFKINVNSLDITASTKKSKARDEYYGKMILKNDMAKIEEQSGLKLVEQGGFTPETPEDIEMYMDTEFRLPIEISMEELNEYIFNQNDYDEIKPRLFHDLVENNKMAIRWYYDQNMNIRNRYVDIERLIHSFSDDPFFNDTEYYAEVVFLTIREIRRRANGNLSEEDLFNIAKLAAGKNGNPSWRFGDYNNYAYIYNTTPYQYDDFRIECLDFVFYSTDVYKYEKKVDANGNFGVYSKKMDYTPPKESKYDRSIIEKQVENEYEGLWVSLTNYMVSYGRSKNITREQKNGKLSPRCLHKFVVVEPNMRKGQSISIIEQIRPNLDMIQLATLRKRHVLAEAVPPGLAIDWDALSDVAAQLKMSHQDLIKMYKQKGILITKGKDSNDMPNYSKPVAFMTEGIGDAIRPYLEIYVDELNKINTLLGLNTPGDAMQPDKRALVGVEKLALLESNNVTREITEAYIYGILTRSGKVVCRMIQDQFKYGVGMSLYEDVIGHLDAKNIEFIPEDLALAELGIFVEALPDAVEVSELSASINDAMKAGEISYEDSLIIKSIFNTKKASLVLAFKKKKRQKEMLELKAQEEQITAQREQQTMMVSAELEKMKAMAKAEAEIMVLREEYRLKAELLSHEANTKVLPAIDREGHWDVVKIEEAQNAKLKATEGTAEAPQPKVFSNPAEAATRVTE